MSHGGLRRAWQLHGAVLAALVIFYVVLFWDYYTGPPPTGFDGEGFGASILLVVLVGYASISSFVMLFIGRNVWGPIVLHTLVLGGYGVALGFEKRDARARAAAEAERLALAERARVDRCLQVRVLRVRAGEPLGAAIELYNDCEVAVTIDEIGLLGFPPHGERTRFAESWREATTLQPGRGATFGVEPEPPVDPVEPDDRWAWLVDVVISTPARGSACFATPRAPGAPACRPIDRVLAVHR